MPDLSTPEHSREFVAYCIGNRVNRTPAQLAAIMPEWLQVALFEHAPHLGVIHAAAEQHRLAYEAATELYVSELAKWAATVPDPFEGHFVHCYVRDGAHCSCGHATAPTSQEN